MSWSTIYVLIGLAGAVLLWINDPPRDAGEKILSLGVCYLVVFAWPYFLLCIPFLWWVGRGDRDLIKKSQKLAAKLPDSLLTEKVRSLSKYPESPSPKLEQRVTPRACPYPKTRSTNKLPDNLSVCIEQFFAEHPGVRAESPESGWKIFIKWFLTDDTRRLEYPDVTRLLISNRDVRDYPQLNAVYSAFEKRCAR